MTNNIGIGIQAQFDTAGVEQQLNALGQKIAAANKVQFTPFSGTTKADLDKIIKQFEHLLKINGELRKRINATGQTGAGLFNLDWDKLSADPVARAKMMRRAFEYSTGTSFHASAPPPQPPGQKPPRPGGGGGGGGGPKPPGLGDVGAQVAQAGLRAAGPAGGVAAGALSTGMSAGFGAGLMGLLGGMLALGVGKLVGSVTEKVGQAEDNAVALDRLKRTLGDVNVSFNALKAVVHGGADQLRITYAESERLASQFVKLGNVSGDKMKTLNDELGVGVGLSRAFGMDPSQGMGVMGQMRGMGVTTNTQESRRFALLIGETIGKSGAFAKAEEVMEAIASYATSQTRNNMGVANVAGYAGMFSSMVGSGIPGMDPQGAAGLLARVNAALSAGGAKGEASQFFTAMVGNRLGLDPIQTQILREGGAFATNESMFGAGSAAARYGLSGPTGNKTFLQATLEQLRSTPSIANNKGLLAQATANHLGVNMNQAMALLSVNPNEIGEMQKYGDLSKLSMSGIGNLSKALYGSDSDRSAIRGSLLSRSDLSSEDRAALNGPDGTSRELLARLSAQYEQERTTGSDIRDSKNALDNIKVALADKLVPFTQAMRDGILFMAGGGKKSRLDVLKDIEGVESKGRTQALQTEFEARLKAAGKEKAEADAAVRELFDKNRKKVLAGEMTQEEHQKQMEPLLKRQQEAMKKDGEAREWHTKALEKERKLLEDNIKKLEEANTAEMSAKSSGGMDFGTAPGNQSLSRRRSGGSSGRVFSTGGNSNFDDLFIKYGRMYGVDPALLKAIAMKESSLNPDAVSGVNANGTRDYGLMQHNSRYHAERGLTGGAWANPERSVEEAAKLLKRNIEKAGSVRGGVRMYNGSGPRAEAYADDIMASVPGVTVNGSTPLPETAGGQNFSPRVTPLQGEMSVRLDLSEDARRLLQKPSAPMSARVGPAVPFGTHY